jgi:hypothetical protein
MEYSPFRVRPGRFLNECETALPFDDANLEQAGIRRLNSATLPERLLFASPSLRR